MNLDLDEIMPLACHWVQMREKEILDKGIPLTEDLIKSAKNLGVNHPDKVRIMLVNKIPMPDDPLLQAACRETGLISDNTAGLTLCYGIYVRKDYQADRNLYLHGG